MQYPRILRSHRFGVAVATAVPTRTGDDLDTGMCLTFNRERRPDGMTPVRSGQICY
jgi:hypothetical protein